MKKNKSHQIAVFASGSGTNAEMLIRNFQSHESIEVALVLSNKAEAGVLKRAHKLNVPAIVFNRADLYDNKSVMDVLTAYSISFIVLAGFLWKIPDYLLVAFPKSIINIHPALLPAYGGKNMYGNRVHQAVKDNAENETGISIHYVNENYDEGAIIFQAKCAIDPVHDSVDDIAEKVHKLEYEHYPKIVERLLLNIKS